MPGPKKKGNPIQRVLEDPKLMFAALGAMGVAVVAVWAIGASSYGSADTAMLRTKSGESKWTSTAGAELTVKRPVSGNLESRKFLSREDSLGLTNSKQENPSLAKADAQSAGSGSANGAASQAREGQKRDAPSALPTHAQPDVSDEAVPDSTAMVQDRVQAAGGALNGFDPSSSNGGFVSGGYGNGAAPDAAGGPVGLQGDGATGRTAQVASASGGTPAIRGQVPGRSFLGGTSGAGRRVPGSSSNRQATASSAGSAATTSGFMGAVGGGAAPAGGASGPGAKSAFGRAAADKGGTSGFQVPGVGGGGGGGGGEGGRGDFLGSGGGGSSGRTVSPASKYELKAQAKDHYAAAETYRGGVALPMLNRQRASATTQAAALKAQSLVLGGLKKAVDRKAKEFRDLPEAQGLLKDASVQVSGMKTRLDSSVSEIVKGASYAKNIPNNCTMKKTVTQRVYVPGKFGFGGKYENKTITTDYRTLSLKGQDMMDAGIRRAQNVGIEAEAGANMTGDAFGPVIDSLRAHPDPKQAARAASLEAIAVRIQNDLDGVASKLPDAAARVGAVAGKQTPHATVKTAALAGVRKARELNDKIGRRGPGYPEIGAKQNLFRAMSDTILHSENALVVINGMTGGAGDSLNSLHAAGQSATKAYVRLCDGYHNLKTLESKAK